VTDAKGPVTTRAPHRATPSDASITAYGFPLAQPDLADAELIAWAQGYLAGWERGEREGRAAERLRHAYESAADEITAALGGSDCPDRREAIRRHSVTVDAIRRRQLADLGRLVA
jgi:hypothetical protein